MGPSYGLAFFGMHKLVVASPERGLLQQVKQTWINSQPRKNNAPRSSIPEKLFWLMGSDVRGVFSLEGTRGELEPTTLPTDG